VVETALNEETTEHLGHEKNQAEPDRGSTNVRNGTRSKTVISDAAGEVENSVPGDRESCLSRCITSASPPERFRHTKIVRDKSNLPLSPSARTLIYFNPNSAQAWDLSAKQIKALGQWLVHLATEVARIDDDSKATHKPPGHISARSHRSGNQKLHRRLTDPAGALAGHRAVQGGSVTARIRRRRARAVRRTARLVMLFLLLR